jgi:apolipoprotein N-acyltransferase
LDKIIPNISLEGESFFYFFGFIFLVFIAVFIILWVNLMFNKKAVRRTNILGIIILLPFVIFIFLLIMFLKNFS